MTAVITNTNTEAATETETAKRGRPALTFADIVAREPHEVDVAFATYLTETFNAPTDPKSVRLLSMPSVRKMFYATDEYNEAERKRQERVDAAKLATVNVSIESLLAKLSPEQIAALAAKLSA